MPRRREIKKREISPDPIYNSILLNQFINCVMKGGKKSTAEGIVYRALDQVKRKANDDPLKVFKKAVDNVKPSLEVKSRRVGGSTYQVPVEVNPNRRVSLALRWLLAYGASRPERALEDKMAGEILDAANNKGGAIKKREDTHKMAEANKAFAHYRW
ncbi:MAG: 30S ribosomal protein S7 [Acidobacteria bacterium]|nr:30S ribosomal protein S7 [Acidobacteriota bacterium]